MIVCDDNQDDFGPKQEPALPTANTVKTLQRCWKNEGEWTGKVEIRKVEIPGRKQSMKDYILTYSRL